MRISDWSSDVCSSDLEIGDRAQPADDDARTLTLGKVHQQRIEADDANIARDRRDLGLHHRDAFVVVEHRRFGDVGRHPDDQPVRSEEHTSELQSLMRTSYAVFCLKNKKSNTSHTSTKTPSPTLRPCKK